MYWQIAPSRHGDNHGAELWDDDDQKHLSSTSRGNSVPIVFLAANTVANWRAEANSLALLAKLGVPRNASNVFKVASGRLALWENRSQMAPARSTWNRSIDNSNTISFLARSCLSVIRFTYGRGQVNGSVYPG
jgi:hypothetical protein